MKHYDLYDLHYSRIYAKKEKEISRFQQLKRAVSLQLHKHVQYIIKHTSIKSMHLVKKHILKTLYKKMLCI